MPSCPRSDVVCVGEVAVYHCWSRCVRRAFLCGQDPLTGNDYEYRREWIRGFEETLAGLFGIEVGFHAEMGNHLHLVLRTRPDVVQTWSDEEVARRWLAISHLTKSRDGQLREISPARVAIEMVLPRRVATLRSRLANPSFFMAALCEHIARRSNREDGCRGSFWENRFDCRELADEGALLVCGIYVDLNQIRAGEAATPETSTHTSAFDRIASRDANLPKRPFNGASTGKGSSRPDGWLCELTIAEGPTVAVREGVQSVTSRRASDKGMLPISLDDYLQLLDTTGRMVREDKAGSIPQHLSPILERLGIRTNLWSQIVTNYDDWFGHVVGTTERVARRAAQVGRKWFRGKSRCAEAFA